MVGGKKPTPILHKQRCMKEGWKKNDMVTDNNGPSEVGHGYSLVILFVVDLYSQLINNKATIETRVDF